MALANNVDSIGIPPQLRSTLKGLNSVMSDLGFPRWTLVKWQVPPLLTFWLVLTLLLSGLKWFALTEIIFILYKFFEEYGEPVSNWVNGHRSFRPHRRSRSISQSNRPTTSSPERTTTYTSSTKPTTTPTTTKTTTSTWEETEEEETSD